LKEIFIAVGTKENLASDIHILGNKWSQNPRVLVVSGKDIKATIIEKTSALFLEENLVLILTRLSLMNSGTNSTYCGNGFTSSFIQHLHPQIILKKSLTRC